jgi:hypothetical protein
MATKPSTEPRWADAQTDPDAVTTTPTSGEQDQGWHDDEIPTAGVFNWFFNLVYQWIAYVNASFRADGAGVRYVDRTTRVPIQGFAASANWTFGLLTAGNVTYWLADTAATSLASDLPVATGDRVKAVTVRVQDTVGFAMTLKLWDYDVAADTRTQLGSTQTSAADGTLQLLQINGLTTVVTSGHRYEIEVRSGATPTSQRFLSATMSTDCVT